MAFGGAAPGSTQLKPGQAQNLVAALSANAGPPNPKTLEDRQDPKDKQVLDLQRVRRALEILKDGMVDGDPVKTLIGSFHSAITRLRDGVNPETVLQSLLATISPPPMMAGGIGMPPGQAPPAPGPSTAGAPPAAPPVAPGPPGQ